MVTDNPATNIGIKKAGSSAIFIRAKGNQAARLLDLAKKDKVISKVIIFNSLLNI